MNYKSKLTHQKHSTESKGVEKKAEPKLGSAKNPHDGCRATSIFCQSFFPPFVWWKSLGIQPHKIWVWVCTLHKLSSATTKRRKKSHDNNNSATTIKKKSIEIVHSSRGREKSSVPWLGTVPNILPIATHRIGIKNYYIMCSEHTELLHIKETPYVNIPNKFSCVPIAVYRMCFYSSSWLSLLARVQ